MENVCAVPGELMDHITRGKEPAEFSPVFRQKTGTLQALSTSLMGRECGSWVQTPKKRKGLEGRLQLSLKSLLRMLAQPTHQRVITKPLTPCPTTQKSWRRSTSRFIFLKKGWGEDIPLFKVRVALPGSEDNMKAKNNRDTPGCRLPGPGVNIHAISLGAKAELRMPNNLCAHVPEIP